MTQRLHDRLISFVKDRRGSAVIETALVLPFLMILVLGGTEVTRYVMLNQKLDRAAMTVADLVAQEEDITVAEMNAIFDAVTPILNPFTLGANGTLIVTSISRSGTTTTVNWRQTFGGGGSTSGVGASSGLNGITLNDGETVIVGEVFYRFTPYFAPNDYTTAITAQDLYKVAYYRTRVGSLTTITP
jgi:Flp pilus assembly protein TadG